MRCKILDSAFDAAILLQLWESAFDFGAPLVAGYKLWYGENHPLTAILLLKLFKIYLLLSSPTAYSKAVDFYRQAVDIIEITHGKSSSFYCQEVKPLMQQLN